MAQLYKLMWTHQLFTSWTWLDRAFS